MSKSSETANAIAKGRGRPESLTLTRLFGALTHEPQSGPSIADALGVSRATVHRKLTEMLGRNLVVASGRGRARTYRVPSVIEQIEVARAEVASKQVAGSVKRCRLVLDAKSSYRLVDDLDMAMRLGIGQFEIVEESIRHRLFGPAQIVSDEAMDKLSSLVPGVKFDLLCMTSGASHGILSEHVDPVFGVMRSLLGAIRHRLAWDRNPQGSIGVHHDEPIERARVQDEIIVYSAEDQRIEGERLVIVEASSQTFAILAEGVKLTQRIQNGDFMAMVDLAREGKLKRIGGTQVPDSSIECARHLIEAMTSIWSEESQKWSQARRDLESSRSIMQGELVSAIGRVISGSAVAADYHKQDRFVSISELKGDEPMFGLTIPELPQGYFLHRAGDLYRVIGPDTSPDHLRIYAESASPQTAVLMAKNVIEGARARSFGF